MFAITDGDGYLVDVVDHTLQQAKRVAWTYGAAEVVYDDSYDWQPGVEMRAVAGNPRDLDRLDPARAPQAAWRAAGKISMPMDEVAKMSLVDAHQLLYPYFERLRLTETGERPQHWARPTGMADSLLRQNFKTAKSHPMGATDVQGLSLLPKTFWSKKLGGEKWIGRKVDFCIAASQWCEKACLVYSGRQQVDVYNTELKECTVDALVEQPVAFGRMLFDSCRRQQGSSIGIFLPKSTYSQATGEVREVVPFVRLNVLSDLPWEIVFPGLFELLPGLSFYDYTKVPGREVPPNYDLTFSYSGANHRTSVDVLNRGGKVAVVFFKRRQQGERSRWPTHAAWIRGEGPFPRTLFGAEVIDGDVSDVRPFDGRLAKGPPPWIVGLRYKAPRGQAFDPSSALFVVPCWELDGQIITVQVPRDTPGTLQAVMDVADREMQCHVAAGGAPQVDKPTGVVPLSRVRRRR